MLAFSLTLSREQRTLLSAKGEQAVRTGDARLRRRVAAILAYAEGVPRRAIGKVLQVSVETVGKWIKAFVLNGAAGLHPRQAPGRPPKLTKTQKEELGRWIDEGPERAGYQENCWRTPLIQHSIQTRFGVTYSVHYIHQLLDNMGYSYQKAKFVSDHLDEEAREQWVRETWPGILAYARKKAALLLFGDEVSFPQWGSLSYTWARRGVQPTVRTSGKRKGFKVFGLIDYFTGRFFSKGIEDRFNSDSYAQFLSEVMAQTTSHIVLIQDGASYHTSKDTRKFLAAHQHRITVFQLPSYSPDYNPIEKLWKKVKKLGTHLKYFPTFADLKLSVIDALNVFRHRPQEVLALFGFYFGLSGIEADLT